MSSSGITTCHSVVKILQTNSFESLVSENVRVYGEIQGNGKVIAHFMKYLVYFISNNNLINTLAFFRFFKINQIIHIFLSYRGIIRQEITSHCLVIHVTLKPSFFALWLVDFWNKRESVLKSRDILIFGKTNTVM